ncbi:MAG: hypothetical protein H6765_09195 [Candidatus Peribacteria bacterium]|nr:MAG: hypothetical protein H6765_09195 [Candidatus Peribacteria bacterium]
MESIQQIVIADNHETPIYLADIAKVQRGEDDYVPATQYSDGQQTYEAVFL